MEWYYNLPAGLRWTILAVGLALFGFVLWVGIASSNDTEPKDAPTPDSSVPIQEPANPSATSEPTESTTESPSPEEAEDEEEYFEESGRLPDAPEPQELSDEDIMAAQDAAALGVVEWLHVDSRESHDARQERISQYVLEGSPMWLENPVGSDVDYTDNPESTIYSVATLGTLDPIGGTEEDFRVIAALTLEVEITIGTGEDMVAQRFSENDYYELSVRKTDGEWKLYNYEAANS